MPDGKALHTREEYVCGSFATFGNLYDLSADVNMLLPCWRAYNSGWSLGDLTNLAECCFSAGLCVSDLCQGPETNLPRIFSHLIPLLVRDH